MPEQVLCPRCRIHKRPITDGGFCPLCEGKAIISKELFSAYLLQPYHDAHWDRYDELRKQFAVCE